MYTHSVTHIHVQVCACYLIIRENKQDTYMTESLLSSYDADSTHEGSSS